MVALKRSNKMTFRELVGKRVDKEVKFMGMAVKIVKLSVDEVMKVQASAKTLADAVNAGDDTVDQITILREIIVLGAPDASELSPEEFRTFPLDELRALSDEILKFSGLTEQGK